MYEAKDEDVNSAIKEGWNAANNFKYSSTECLYEVIKPEYLITVLIADKLIQKNQIIGEPYCVKLEEETSRVFANCFPIIQCKRDNRGFVRFGFIKRKWNDAKRPGKFDIAVYTKNSQRINELESRYVIEVKDFKPSKADIRKDAIRIIELFSNDAEKHESSLLAGYITFAIETKPEDIEDYSNWVTNKYKWLTSISDIITCEIVPFEVSKCIPENESEADDFHFFAGVIVKFSKTKSAHKEISAD